MSEDRDAEWYAKTFGVADDLWVTEARGTGMPGLLLLHQFGQIVYDGFGVYPWLVGTALTDREPHDIDVRLVLSGQEFKRYCGQRYGESRPNTPWASFSMAYALTARHMTDLPVDFQIQTTAMAAKFSDCPRLVLGGWFVAGKRVSVRIGEMPDANNHSCEGATAKIIVVNGRSHAVSAKYISHLELTALANLPTNETPTVTFSGGLDGTQGMLGSVFCVALADRMTFNVVVTGKG